MRRLMGCWSCLVVCSFTWAAFAQAPEKVKDKEPVREFVVKYYPLQEGHQWVYALGKKEVTITVGQKESRAVAKGKDKAPEWWRCYRLHIVSEDKKLTEVVGVLDDGIYRFEAAGKAISPPLCILNFKSATWECKSESANAQMSGTFTFKAEAVTVPVEPNPLNAFKVSCPDFTLGEQSMSIDTWYVENLGMVKQRVKLENHDELVLELKTFRPAK